MDAAEMKWFRGNGNYYTGACKEEVIRFGVLLNAALRGRYTGVGNFNLQIWHWWMISFDKIKLCVAKHLKTAVFTRSRVPVVTCNLATRQSCNARVDSARNTDNDRVTVGRASRFSNLSVKSWFLHLFPILSCETDRRVEKQN